MICMLSVEPVELFVNSLYDTPTAIAVAHINPTVKNKAVSFRLERHFSLVSCKSKIIFISMAILNPTFDSLLFFRFI